MKYKKDSHGICYLLILSFCVFCVGFFNRYFLLLAKKHQRGVSEVIFCSCVTNDESPD